MQLRAYREMATRVLSEQGIMAKLVGDDDTKPEPAAATTNDNDASSATGCGWSARNPSDRPRRPRVGGEGSPNATIVNAKPLPESGSDPTVCPRSTTGEPGAGGGSG
ncbi:hypothetical protein GCM10010177_47240 [Actinomadura citrea]|nr:hypothetical protein GCM10010177_47240 [Actinomadura citrea]